jgi:hypothetical protein
MEMDRPASDGSDGELSRNLIEELLRTSLILGDTLATLIEQLPEDAFPGEDSAAVLIEMASATCRPVIDAAGAANCRSAIALIGAVRDRFLADLEAAARLAAGHE